MQPSEALHNLAMDVAQQLQVRRVHIAVVGDMILDCTIEGAAGGVHPETQVPILRDATSHESIGGAGNIALALTRLGAEVSVFGIIGSDLTGRQLQSLLDRQPFADYLIIERGWPTPRKDWVYRSERDRSQLIQRIDYDRPLTSRAREELVGEFRARCPADVQAVILADHGLGSIASESLALIELARQRRAKLVAIPRSTVLRGQPLDAIVLNASEMRRIAQSTGAGKPAALASQYARDFAQHVFLTLLEEGLVVCPKDFRGAEGVPIEGYPLSNPQWMGARDITTAVVALGLALDVEPVELGRLANVFRHLVASQRGNGRVLWRDVFQFLGMKVTDERSLVSNAAGSKRN